MRFSLLSGLGLIAFAGVLFAAMMYRTAGWTSVAVSLVALTYAIMIVRAIALPDLPRTFALGFVVVGISYLVLARTSLLDMQSFLVTNYPLAWVARFAELPPTIDPPGGGFFSVPVEIEAAALATLQFGSASGGGNPRTLEMIIEDSLSRSPLYLELHRFFVLGHLGWSCIFSWIAGVGAVRLKTTAGGNLNF